MKRSRKFSVNMLICFIILAGFCSVLAISYNTYSKIIKDDIRNISKLTATNIYSEISNQLTKPIFVALTMANDRFVQDWLEEEKDDTSSSLHQEKMINYLNGLKEKYNYNSVFLVSNYSKIYYHFEGINKVISENDEHDQWYYDYIKSKLSYVLDVDTDEVNHNKLSIFINCRIEDEDGSLLGVTGVGLELDKVQELLRKYKDDFQLEAMLFDKNGVVQVHSNVDYIEKTNVFDYETLNKNKASILNNKDSVAVYRYRDGNSEGYMIVKYIEDLDWYLLVKKDTSVLVSSFHSYLLKDLIIFIAVFIFIIIIVDRLVTRNDNNLLHIAKTDTLTGLINRRGFDETLECILRNLKDGDHYYLFVFDIDNFKNINDIYGHLTGDKVICRIGNHVKECLKTHGEVFRWGGDEFSGYINSADETIEEKIADVYASVRNASNLQKYNATISMGITVVHKTDSIDTLLKRADKALYQAKQSGKNKYVFYQ